MSKIKGIITLRHKRNRNCKGPVRKGVLRNFVKFAAKYSRQILFNKVTG